MQDQISIPSARHALPRARLADYVAIARPDHWIKHIFIVPGIVLAVVLHRLDFHDLNLLKIVVGFLSAAAIASSNYVLNEWIDARFDAFHPKKSQRPAVATAMSPGLVALECVGLALLGLGLALMVSKLYLILSTLFLLSGFAYNVPPVRTKDRIFLDVLSESFNNPIRLTLGWAIVDSHTLPPSSLLFAYWMGGAFLMALKRFAERRAIAATGNLAALGLYRRSFRAYTESSLLVSTFLYALLAAFFLAVFLIKYRVEYLLSLPLFAALFSSYLRIGLKQDSSAQAPEKLFREKTLMFLVALLTVALAVLTWVDIPALEKLTSPHYIELTLD